MILAITERTENVRGEEPFHQRFYLAEYFKNIFDACGVLLFPVVSEKQLEKVCALCDGLVLTGSAANVHPHYYREEPLPGQSYDVDEFALDRAAIGLFHQAGKPILGICRGIQSINVAFGGSLYQDIDHHDGGRLHPVRIQENSFLAAVYRRDTVTVNSFHRQAVREAAAGFSVTARAEDGTIEALERENMVGVQWHPEQMNDLPFFQSFLKTFF